MRKIRFIRHAKANAADAGTRDRDRLLSTAGVEQALRRRDSLSHEKFDLVISSSALRAVMTAGIVSDKSVSDMIILKELYPDPHDDPFGVRIDKMFRELGYAPMSDYQVSKDAGILVDWGNRTWKVLESKILSRGNPNNVAIFGHFICLQTLAMIVCQLRPDLVKEIASVILGECEGFRISIDKKGYVESAELIRG